MKIFLFIFGSWTVVVKGSYSYSYIPIKSCFIHYFLLNPMKYLNSIINVPSINVNVNENRF